MSTRHQFIDHPYYSDSDLQELRECNTLQQTRDIALRVLEGMRRSHPGAVICQVCGPITTGPGTIEEKMFRFERAIIHVRKEGFVVFNQLPTEVALGNMWLKWGKSNRHGPEYHLPGHYYWELLFEFYQPLFESGHIGHLRFMPNWELSYGAIWEYHEALRLSYQVSMMPIDWETL